MATSLGAEPPSSSYRSVIHDANIDATPVLVDEFQSDTSLRFAVRVSVVRSIDAHCAETDAHARFRSRQLLGDWGGMERRGTVERFPFTTQAQVVVAEALSQTVRRRDLQFVVSLVRLRQTLISLCLSVYSKAHMHANKLVSARRAIIFTRKACETSTTRVSTTRSKKSTVSQT